MLTDNTETDAYLYGGSPIQFKELVDSNLYDPDCRKAFAYYFNQQRGTSYSIDEVDSIFSTNQILQPGCGTTASCSGITVPSSGVSKPTTVSCNQLIRTYKNFMADFPDPRKGATVKMYKENNAIQNFDEAESQMVVSSNNNGSMEMMMPDSMSHAQADTIPAPSMQSFDMMTMSNTQSTVNMTLVDTFLNGKALIEWYFNAHLNTSGYTYGNFMDWLVNTCGYALPQLPLSNQTVACCDSLGTILNEFLVQYPTSLGSTITESKVVPVHKVSHMVRSFDYSGNPINEFSAHSAGSIAALTWTSGHWLQVRDNVSFNFNVLPKNASINTAFLNLYAKPDHIEYYPCCGAHYRSTVDSIYGIFERLTGFVIPGQTLWSNQPSALMQNRVTLAPISLPNGSSATEIFSNENYLNQPVTNLVQDLYSAAAVNHNNGLLFKLSQENLSYKAYTFWGITDTTPQGKQPHLVVNYTAERCEVFAAFVNNKLGTSLSQEEIRQLFKRCGMDLDFCPDPTSYSKILLCGKVEPMNEFVTELQVSPCEDSILFATITATELYRRYKDSLEDGFNNAYLQKCLGIAGQESFTVTRPASEYHYTLYYYDLAGNLVKTIPPEGVQPERDELWLEEVAQKRTLGERKVPQHLLATIYRYNTLNQVVSQKSPDGGKSEFWYDRLGRLVVSQNAKQKPLNRYSYTKYDKIGRIVEVGEKPQPNPISQDITRNDKQLNWWLYYQYSSSTYRIVNAIVTKYDELSNLRTSWADPVTKFKQTAHTLRNRVSYSRFVNTLSFNRTISGGDTTYTPIDGSSFESGVDYNYDIHGNVASMLNIYGTTTMMGSFGANRFKLINYYYDLISGKVNEVHYQPGSADEFYQRYEYDADNRLTDVYTTDARELLRQTGLEEHEAYYEYYKHGPLARVVLGQQQVQGLDYAYTLQGWLKGVNSISLNAAIDMGGDGNSLSPNARVARDAFGFNLNYFNGDYSAIGAVTDPFPGHTGFMPAGAYKGLYNGNISSMAVNIGILAQPQLYNYQYDQLNRLVAMDTYRGLNQSTNAWQGIVKVDDNGERIKYDGNGNIRSYLRHGTTAGGKPLAMDSLNYAYNEPDGKLTNNRLRHVTDNVNASNYPEDLDGQGLDNYEYDAIGNLVKDTKEGITNITWDVYGKIRTITKASGTITYSYDASGNRVSKTAGGVTTWYARDAQGNVMAVYQKGSDGLLRLKEHHLYGSSRLGLNQRDQNMSVTKVTPVNGGLIGNTYSFSQERGQKVYELNNHLGNVLATISDKKIAVPLSGNSSLIDYYTADIVTAQDYTPFGMLMNGRKFSAGTGYRYGFNGKENDNELKGEGGQQDYGMRIYDPRLGKFLSVDPLTSNYPELTPYQFASNSPITFIDLDGEELAYKMPDGSIYIQPPSDRLRPGLPHGAKLMTGQIAKPNKEDVSLTLDLLPGINVLKGGYEAKTGKDLITGEDVSATQRFFGMIPYMGKGNKIIKVVNAADKLNEAQKVTKAFVKLSDDGINYALSFVDRLQHSYKHAKDIKGFIGKNWNKTIEKEWKAFNKEILQNATASFDNSLGGLKVKGFYRKVDGQDIAVQVYAEGDKAGKIATTVVLNENQMIKFGLKSKK